ncbi:MAG: hypothetical protein Phog2KO_31620 [Phototrophicaceae bacterium]
MDSILAPEQVASIIETMPLNISILESDSDRITFQHHTEDMLVDGIIQRWQGTESHIEIVAELSQALLSNTRRNVIITVSILIASMISIILIYLFTKVTCTDLGVTGACYAYDGLSYWEIISLLVIIWGIVGAGLWFLIKRDTKIAKRWQAQQKLGVIVKQIFDHIRQQENE